MRHRTRSPRAITPRRRLCWPRWATRVYQLAQSRWLTLQGDGEHRLNLSSGGLGRLTGTLYPAVALLRARPMERERRHPEGAALRADQQRGESWRGRQRVLLLPRLDADALVHEVSLQVSPGRLPVRRAHRDQPAPEPAEFEYDLLD